MDWLWVTLIPLVILLYFLLRWAFRKYSFKVLYQLYCSRLGLQLHRRNLRASRLHPPHSKPESYKRQDVEVHIIPILADNYSYLVVDPITRCAAAVDPADAQTVLETAERVDANITHVLTTHDHWDHAGGNQDLRRALGNDLIIVGSTVDSVHMATKLVGDEDEFMVGNLQVTVYAAPCHTRGHVIFEIDTATTSSMDSSSPPAPEFIMANPSPSHPPSQSHTQQNGASRKPRLLFTGDAIFVAGAGHFFEGSSKDMVATVRRILPFRDDTLMFCGHEYSKRNLRFSLTVEPQNTVTHRKLEEVISRRREGRTTMPSVWGEEKLYNPYLRVVKGDVYEFRQYTASHSLDLLNAKKSEFSVDYRDDED